MKIIVPPDIELALTEHAQKRGKTPEDLALDALRERFVSVPTPTDSKETLADFLAGHIGVLSSSEVVRDGASMSENCGKKFADVLTEKRKQGRL